MTESELQSAVANYIASEYPDVLFHSDFGSGIKLAPWQAKKQAEQNAYRRGWPDMFIAQPAPRCVDGIWKGEWHGLFIELKRDGTRLRKRNGDWATAHIEEQAKVLANLESEGYMARFIVGYREAVEAIDEYLKFYRRNDG